MKPDNFLLIAITRPEIIVNETGRILTLLDEGFDFVHIRKPQWTELQMRQLIESITPDAYPYLRVHSHFNLAVEYGLNGVHLNHNNPHPVENAGYVSRSCHQIEELDEPWPETDGCIPSYQTLSPIFDSISKKGYNSNFKLEEISENILNKSVIGLGGVTFDKLKRLREVNFIGAAMLGAIW